MNSPEVFYLHIQGEQRGPYTIAHIDHLLNCGLINEDALFWREGLEQWQPVTDLVVRRQPKNRWKRPAIVAGILLVVVLLARLFGPITVEGWRESNQSEFTQEAAYWRARDVVRNQSLPRGAVVEFGKLSDAAVGLRDGDGAMVFLRGRLTGTDGKTRPAMWQIMLKYDGQSQEWAGVFSAEVPPQ